MRRIDWLLDCHGPGEREDREDAIRICNRLAEMGWEVPPLLAATLWREFSDREYCAGWLMADQPGWLDRFQRWCLEDAEEDSARSAK